MLHHLAIGRVWVVACASAASSAMISRKTRPRAGEMCTRAQASFALEDLDLGDLLSEDCVHQRQVDVGVERADHDEGGHV